MAVGRLQDLNLHDSEFIGFRVFDATADRGPTAELQLLYADRTGPGINDLGEYRPHILRFAGCLRIEYASSFTTAAPYPTIGGETIEHSVLARDHGASPTHPIGHHRIQLHATDCVVEILARSCVLVPCPEQPRRDYDSP